MIFTHGTPEPAEFDSKLSEAELASLLDDAQRWDHCVEWMDADPDTGFNIGYSGIYMLSFTKNGDDPGDKAYIAVLEFCVPDGDPATLMSERFVFTDERDARARAVRLLLLAVGPKLLTAVRGNPAPHVDENGERVKSAAEDALDAIAKLCGCAEWDYPGQVVRDVQGLVHARELERSPKTSAAHTATTNPTEPR